MRITTEMISNVIWSDMLDSDDYWCYKRQLCKGFDTT